MFKRVVGSLAIMLIALGSAVAADDASMHEVYEAANSGHLAQAQEMIGKVLRDHPESAKAHYVAAEVDARQGQLGGAREQLQTAERLAPGLPFAKPEAVQSLRAELAAAGSSQIHERRSSGSGLSTGMMILIGIGAALLIMMLLRRLSPPGQTGYPANAGGGFPQRSGGYPPQSGGYAPPMGMPPSGGGLGSTIVGGLAGGLAVGAGVVAGEALMNRMMDGGQHGGDRGRFDQGSFDDQDLRGNADMGGNDFGVADSGSWDDSSSSISDSGGGDDDWS